MLNAQITAHVPQSLTVTVTVTVTVTLTVTVADSHSHTPTHTHTYNGRVSNATWQPFAFDGKQML